MSSTSRRNSPTLLQAAAILGAALLAAAPAAANPGAAIAISSNFPATATVGDTFAAELTINNTSDADVPILDVLHIHLNTSCSDVAHPCVDPDAGVFDLGSTGTGSGACAGITFDIVDGGDGLYTFVPDAPVALPRIVGGGESCVISFQATVTGLPATDADPGAAGLQTRQVAHVVSQGLSDITGLTEDAEGTGTDTITIQPRQEPNQIPTVSEWGLLLFAGILALLGVQRLVRS